MKALLLAFLVVGSSAYAQDASVTIAQQAGLQAAQQVQQNMMTAGQATLQAGQQLAQFNQRVMQQMQDMGVETNRYVLHIPPWNTWRVSNSSHLDLSVKSGPVKPGTKVRIKWRGSDYAAVYYTTNGRRPTLASNRYTGPIAINASTHLQAIGIGWNCNIGNECGDWNRSQIVDAYYSITTGPHRVKSFGSRH